MLLKSTADQNADKQHEIPVLCSAVGSAALPNEVNSVQQIPVNNAISQFPSAAVLMAPPFPPPLGPYVHLPLPTHFSVHQDVGRESGSIPAANIQTPSCQVVIPKHHSSQDMDTSRLTQDSHVTAEDQVPETRVHRPSQEQTAHEGADDRRMSDQLDDVLYRDRVLGDDISRERLERRLMKEKIEQWKLRDGQDSDRVEFERLRTPRRNIIDAGTFSAFF